MLYGIVNLATASAIVWIMFGLSTILARRGRILPAWIAFGTGVLVSFLISMVVSGRL
jgi:hypothetical protein